MSLQGSPLRGEIVINLISNKSLVQINLKRYILNFKTKLFSFFLRFQHYYK